jgi:pectate lyase
VKCALLAGVVILFCGISAIAYETSPVGWASMAGGTTGGAGGIVVEVNNAADFSHYVQDTKQTPYIIYVSGNINLGGSNVRVRGNKTIIGLPGSHITGNLKSYRAEEGNNIFRFLNIHNPDKLGDGDCISIDSASHIWIDHCTFTDGGDGNVDIKNGADYITVSWCIFQYTLETDHNFSNLVGHDDGNGDTDMGHLLVTFHHNWYSTLCHERMPSVRFGTAHIYNTYFDCPGNNYCIRTRLYAQCLVENNYFKVVQNPWERYVTSAGGDPGLLHASGNILDNVTWNAGSDSQVVLIDGNDTVFAPPYSYTLDNAQDIPAIVQYGAGADGKDGYPPHWYFGYYGDFDRSGVVTFSDLSQFSQYWLVTDCNAIVDADYDGNCNVNFYEYALLSGNWLKKPLDLTIPAAPSGLWALAGDGTVSLDWDDNTEGDLAGYNIYRSTTSGSGYVKLNSEFLTSSEYTDNSVSNGTTYYYVVTAVDTYPNESVYSGQASATPGSSPEIITLTIEENTTGFCSVDGKIENEWPGFTGTGYANTDNALGKGVNWRVSVPASGTYTFVWRYALDAGKPNRYSKLIANGVTVLPSISFPSSGANTTYIVTIPADANLTAGINDLRLEAMTSDGLANIDNMQVTGLSPQATSCQ